MNIRMYDAVPKRAMASESHRHLFNELSSIQVNIHCNVL